MIFTLRRLLYGKASYYIVALLIIISWVIIGMKVRLIASDAVTEEETDIYSCMAAWEPFNNAAPVDGSLVAPSQMNHRLPTIVDSGLLWLVNQHNPLASDFVPSNLVSHQGIRLQAMAYTAYSQMQTAMKADGIQGLQLASAYRPFDYQQELFAAKINNLKAQGHSPEVAEELASQILQRPGASEHQTGLALDVTVAGDLTEDFGHTAEGKWIAENSHRFGFIIRYPQAKTEITHITYEPWHLRYVGLPHAIVIYENNLTLEEYADFIAEAGAYMVWGESGEARVFYLVKYSETWPLGIPDGLIDISSVCPIGGRGYILTLRGVYPE